MLVNNTCRFIFDLNFIRSDWLLKSYLFIIFPNYMKDQFTWRGGCSIRLYST